MTDETRTPEQAGFDEGVHPAAKPFLWLDHPAAKAAPFWIFGMAAIALLIAEMLHPLHAVSKWDEVFGFYEIEGFFGFCLAVLAGWPLRRLLGRPENYYDQEGDHD